MRTTLIKIDGLVPEVYTLDNFELAINEPLRALAKAGLSFDSANVEVKALKATGNIAKAAHLRVTPKSYPLAEDFIIIETFGDGTVFDLFKQLEEIGGHLLWA